MKKNSPDLVSKKIKVLVNEGVPQKQAVATAISMGKAGRITKSGGYKRVKKK
jgi:translation initiation factor 2B subunit (eIF-2B alpha/beta/delta family)